jgi:hypothetical protein
MRHELWMALVALLLLTWHIDHSHSLLQFQPKTMIRHLQHSPNRLIWNDEKDDSTSSRDKKQNTFSRPPPPCLSAFSRRRTGTRLHSAPSPEIKPTTTTNMAANEFQASLEMGSMTAVGFLLVGSLLLNLAIGDVTIDVSTTAAYNNGGGGLGSLGIIGDFGSIVVLGDDSQSEQDLLNTVANNLLDAALPQSATDVIAVSLGESFGGLVGAYATSLVSFFVTLRMRILGVDQSTSTSSGSSSSFSSSSSSSSPSFSFVQSTQKSFWLDALANTDYFLTRAAAVPTLLACGLDPLSSTLGGVVIATIPYELIKYQGRLRVFRKTENEILQELLVQEQARQAAAQQVQQQQQAQQIGSVLTSARSDRSSSRSSSSTTTITTSPRSDFQSLQPVLADQPPQLDLAEFLTDMILWLEYDVLKSQYSGSLVMMGGLKITDMGAESAVFGFLAALSSQLYLDAMYQWTNLGPPMETMAARNRSVLDLLTVYSTRCLKTAALFGVYETVKEPVRVGMAQVLSGGLTGCWGSSDYDLCVESYLLDTTNPSSFLLQLQDEETNGAGISLDFDIVQEITYAVTGWVSDLEHALNLDSVFSSLAL